MLSNQELYGTDDVPKVPEDVCNERIALLQNRLKEEADKHFMLQSNDMLNKLQSGIKFWQRLRDGEEEH